MRPRSPAEKALQTMGSKSAAVRAGYTKRRKEGTKRGAGKVKRKQWEPEKVKYLLKLEKEADPDTCVVCGDNRSIVLQNHHVNPTRKKLVKLCANCHDVVRRGTLESLEEAHTWKRK